ncbi:helix-turn-helix domain-containing protein [Haladaptatus salinisoli]|uniref:helix-turn-helix domain-containing protein n=1 Tax=Haladaptatus salinisoli TaxID=2884876 RepID=UPI001D0A0E37|nr:helix-turn-helix domain-containing protein [Haladaptatus salinisoli]
MVARRARHDSAVAPLAELSSPRTKLVYLYLNVVDEATVEELHEALGIRYMELYSALRILRERDDVRFERDSYRRLGEDEPDSELAERPSRAQ